MTAVASNKLLTINYLLCNFGGGRGIRTPGTLPGSVVFKTTAIDHSAIPPRRNATGIRALSVGRHVDRSFVRKCHRHAAFALLYRSPWAEIHATRRQRQTGRSAYKSCANR